VISPVFAASLFAGSRLNGYLAGRGTLARLHDELPQLGLSAAAATHLERLVASRTR
jgi:hypothetical protein